MSKNKKKTGFEDSIKPESDYDHLQCHLRPQWGLRTFLLILIFVVVYTAIYIDLEINLKELFRNSSKYIFDVVRRMIPPDFSDFGNTTNFKVAGRYSLGNLATLRGGYSTGFRAPTPGQSNYTGVVTSFDGVSGQQIQVQDNQHAKGLLYRWATGKMMTPIIS